MEKLLDEPVNSDMHSETSTTPVCAPTFKVSLHAFALIASASCWVVGYSDRICWKEEAEGSRLVEQMEQVRRP